MESTSFVPKLSSNQDGISRVLTQLSRVLLVLAVCATPLVFVPGVPNFLGPGKVFMAVFLVLLAIVLYSLSILRSGAVTVRVIPLLLSYWGIVAVAGASALLSPTPKWSLFGDVLEIHTVGFLVLLGALMTLFSSVGMSKRGVLTLYSTLVASTGGLILFQLLRILFGPTFLTFGQFTTLSATPIGSFNDLGLLVATSVLILIVSVVQLKLPRWVEGVIGLYVMCALGLLMIVNFFSIWIFLALFSLLILMYSLTRDRFAVADTDIAPELRTPVGGAVAISAAIFVVSALFLVGGSSLGNVISSTTGVSYLEVRPSVSATAGILRQVYHETALLGSGPNRFSASWQQYKEQAITETIFWNTSFNAGSGFVPTWFVTTGVLGVIAWVIFLGLFLFTGYMTLMRSFTHDAFWYFIGTVSFVVGVFIWGMALVYVPGPVILLVGAAATGSLLVARQKLIPHRQFAANFLTSAKTGFVLIAGVMLVVLMVLGIGYAAVQQVSAAYLFSTVSDSSTASTRIAQAFGLYESPTYVREIARLNLAQINDLLILNEATPAQQELFQQTITSGITAGQVAVRLDPTDARNHVALADLYAVLAVIKIEGAQARADDSYAMAEKLDPTNPYYVLQKSALAYRAGDKDRSRSLALQSLALKSNYTDALLLLSQIDIASGDVKRAITTTQSLIALESNNPGRYYQLGVLYTAIADSKAAIEAFSAALLLEPSYANARYLRALEYARAGNVSLAKSELQTVRELNPENTMVDNVIKQLNRGETVSASSTTEVITEPNPVSVDNEVTTTDTESPNDIVVPVNGSRLPKSEPASAL